MLQRIKSMLLTLGVFSLIAAPVALVADTGLASAAATNTIQGIACGSNLNVSDSSCNASTVTSNDNTSITGILRTIVNIFSLFVGAAAVIMIIIGGFRYITSGGDSNNISSAKNTIIFAIVGLIIVALAQIIVHFVIQRVATAGTS